MSTVKPEPQLPAGNASALQGISENFSFHASPESFITSRVLQLRRERPGVFDRKTVLRVKILNRNVAIVSSYNHIKQVLLQDVQQQEEKQASGRTPTTTTPPYVAGMAYDALMAPFFPGPNLLLADGCPHFDMRRPWDDRMRSCREEKWKDQIRGVIKDFCHEVLDAHVLSRRSLDLYKAMKSLSWRLLLKCFLNLCSNEKLFHEVEELQETLLRGQFSLMPVSVNTWVWKSARRRGIEAREKVEDLIAQRLRQEKGGMFGAVSETEILHVTKHVLMMTSSLAVKGLASLLTALTLNLIGFVDGGAFLNAQVREIESRDAQREFLESIYLETERLSPPIVGIMRRVTEDCLLKNALDEPDILLPKGWDVWLYFVGGARDGQVFRHETPDLFDPRRYLNKQTPQPLGFGLGSKSCLGQELVRSMALAFAEHISISGKYHLSIDEDLAAGVKGWLGWAVASPEEWAADIKQLPTQRPTRPVLVRVTGEADG